MGGQQELEELVATCLQDCLLPAMGFVDLLKIHVGGKGELAILHGAEGSLRARQVGLCLLRTTSVSMGEVQHFLQASVLHYAVRPVREGQDAMLRLDHWATP